jgi:hypothetical protein
MRRTTAILAALAVLDATAILACGQSNDEVEAGFDASTDVAKDSTFDSQTDAGTDADAKTNDAAADAPDDSPCAPAITITGNCADVDGAYCIDYTGPWPQNIAASACPEAGTIFTWDAACPTQARTGTCYSDYGGGLGGAERCYPPLTTQQCQGLCLILDAGFCPN